jgi:outer membrane receptor protein involved in Fe transport
MGRGLGLVCVLFLLGATVARAQPAEPRAAAGRGTVVGTVLDASTAQPIVGATVQVVGQPKLRTETDFDGKFKLSVPLGTYDVRFSADLYQSKVVSKVTVAAGEPARADVSLPPNVPGNVQLVEVKGVREAAEETQLVKRKEAATMSETVGAETISKSTDSDAGEVVTRLPSVTIRDDKFIVVRGLNERYSSALLDGNRLPSTDPNRRIIPLDLFPADFIESLTLIKGYTPDLPGDFAGGLIDIRLAEPPTELTYQIGVALEFNTETTFQRYDTYKSTPLDWFTFGQDFRDLPGIFPDTSFNNPPTSQQRTLVGSLHDNWNIESATAPPNFSIDGSVGKSFGPFGFNLAALYGWKFSTRRDEVLNTPTQIFTYDHSIFETQLGALLTTQYELSPNHKLSGRALVNRQATDDVLDGSGAILSRGDFLSTSTLYTANQLGFGQLEGRHHFDLLDVDWRGAWGPSTQDQPDGKLYSYEVVDGMRRIFTDPGRPVLRTFGNLDEFLQDYYADATIPFATRLPFTEVWSGLQAKFKTGIGYFLRDRNFTFTQLRTLQNGVPLPDPGAPPNDIFVPNNYSQELGPLNLSQTIEPFNANQEIAALYGMFDVPLIRDRLRFIGGSRLEYSYIVTHSRAAVGTDQINTILNDLDPMPSVNLIYTPRDDMNVRAGWSQTVSRPEFRELTPTLFPAPIGERSLLGNPFLVESHITNYDLRWEWFFTPLELASVGFFYKDLSDPIELTTAGDAGGNFFDFYVNADSATVWGFEFEARKDFAFAVPYAERVGWLKEFAPALEDLQLLVNASVVESSVEGLIAPPQSPVTIFPVQGSQRLQGQPPYTINAGLEYQSNNWGLFRLLYNTIGPTIAAQATDTNRDGVPNFQAIEDQQRNQLDFVWLADVAWFGTPLTVKFSAENILNDVYLETQDRVGATPLVTNRFHTGVTFKVGFTYSY